MQYQDIHFLAEKVKKNVARVIIGREEQIDLMLTAMIAGGHVLLEDVPGTGKTMMARAMAKSLHCSFARIQFTPDRLPADITGTHVYQPAQGDFQFVSGPVFTNVLLADEINRATPRTQSALLECMEEKQVTDGGVTRPLEPPFMVIATQNPVETQGTFPLPEAQLDRFLMRLSMGYPEGEEAMQLMERFIRSSPIEEIASVAEKTEICGAQQIFSACQVSEPVMKYIAAICQETRKHPSVQLGVSPRGMLALMRAAQAYAALTGRDYVIPDDVKKLALPVLTHRIIVRGVYGKRGENEKLMLEILGRVPAPTENVS